MNSLSGGRLRGIGEVTNISSVSPRDTNMKIEGWAHLICPDNLVTTAKVQLVCGNTVVRSHRAELSNSNDPDGRKNAFRFFISTGVMKKIGVNERLEIRIEETQDVLPCISDTPMQELAQANAPTGSLEELIAKGWIVSHWGGLELPFAMRPEKKRDLLDLYSRIRVVLSKKLNIDLYVLGGNLLGLVREGDFLDHDYDLDAGICFPCVNSKDAADTFLRVYTDIREVLLSSGFGVKLSNTGHFQVSEPKGEKLGIFFAWLTPEGNYFRPTGKGGYLGVKEFKLEPWEFLGYEILVPVDRERKLDIVYGENWRQPEKDFFPTKAAEVNDAMRDFHARGWKKVRLLKQEK